MRTAGGYGRGNMKRVLLVFLIAAASSAQAQSILIGKRLISKGDPVSRLRDVGAKPDRVDRIEADEYSPEMEVWTYNQGGRAIVVWLVKGKVVQVQEQEAATP
jgi:hypothetical protein